MLKVIAFVIAGFTFDSAAFASCGDYLYVKGKPVSEMNSAMSDHDVRQAHHDESHRIPVSPCRGAKCSKSRLPLMPVPVAPTTLAQGHDQAAILESLIPDTSLRRGNQLPESDRGACFVPSSVFRPPIA